jgi:predicted histone-like DNA-binding protein
MSLGSHGDTIRIPFITCGSNTMAIRVRKIERANPQNRAEKKWYMTKAVGSTSTIEDIARDIEEISTVSRGDILAVMDGLLRTMTRHLSNGNSVRLGNFGSFRTTISSNSANSAEGINANAIKGTKVVFLAGTDMKKTMSSAKYQVVQV